MRRPLRAPFVVTLFLGTACSSGSTNGSPADASTDGTSGVDAQPENPVECPSSDPGFGPINSPCSAPASTKCSYVDRCPFRPASAGAPLNVYVCHDSGAGAVWVLTTDYLPTGCPATPPATGDPCPCAPHMTLATCTWGSCEGLDMLGGQCRTGEVVDATWTTKKISCNPPELDGGKDGDASETDG